MKERAIDRLCKPEVAARIAAVRSAKVKGNFAVYGDHGALESVVCRYCGTPIMGWVDAETKTRSTADGRIINEIRQRFVTLSTYTMASLQLSNGALYTPCMCKECEKKLAAEDDAALEALFCADIEALAREAEAKGLAESARHEFGDAVAGVTVARGRKA